MNKNKKLILNIIFFTGVFVSFVYAYLIDAFGYTSTNNIFYVIGIFLFVGLMYYLMFEVVLIIICRFAKIKFASFGSTEKSFKFIIRIAAVIRNICFGSINFAFMIYPLASVWGVLLSYIIFTVLSMYFAFKIYLNKNKIVNKKQFYFSFSTYLLIYLLFYVILGGVV